jgi:hypothetical protein
VRCRSLLAEQHGVRPAAGSGQRAQPAGLPAAKGGE